MSIIPKINCSLREANAHTEGDCLTVTTGRFQRVWKWTDAGFATREIVDVNSGRKWKSEASGCDWQLPDGSEPSKAGLQALSVNVQDDEGFTSEHVCVVADIAYPYLELLLRLTVWAYPNASGIRTQLWISRSGSGMILKMATDQRTPPDARVERVPAGEKPFRRRLFGYYNNTQNRNDTHLDILKEEVLSHPLVGRESYDWASVLCIEDNAGGLALVKESHKCVNQPGHATGGFLCDEHEGISCTGWGLHADEISFEEFVPAWATWILAWSGDDLDREVAFKTFDSLRYPIDPKRDVYIQANTWGSTDNSRDARRAASQDSVLQELETCADLGIDVLQIDDGWQTPSGHSTWEPGEHGWHPHPGSYPDGWATIRSRASDLGIQLGLWAAAMPISLAELKANHAEGGFVQYKLDFANLRNRKDIESLMRKVRDFIKWTDHHVRVNWDVTENSPRYGYFFAREYGCIYLENRKPMRPLSVMYKPHTVLRDLWQVARYLNLHRFQCSIQNVDRVDPERSDALLHSHSYAVAIALMGIPLFFQQTKYYTDEAKAEIRLLLDVYKRHRNWIYGGIVHPIGDKPDNTSWTGFQCHLPEENRGYLMVFRERCNAEPEHSLRLGWMQQGMIHVKDLLQGTTSEKQVGSGGVVSFRVEHPPGFLFLQYSVETKNAEP